MKQLLSFPVLCKISIAIILCFSNFSCKDSKPKNTEELRTFDSIEIEEFYDDLSDKPLMQIDSTYNLVIFKPNLSKVDLVCIERPSKDNDSIIMMIGAAFTGQRLDKFDHNNICGSHTSGGIYYERPIMQRLTGIFTFSNGKPNFYYKEDSEKILKEVAMEGGSGFMQDMIIHSDSIVPQTRPLTDQVQFRALCLLNNELVVVEANRIIEYGLFIKALKSLGVKEAIYTDMGRGWNYSWYRDNDGNVNELHPGPYKYSSNWLTFYK